MGAHLLGPGKFRKDRKKVATMLRDQPQIREPETARAPDPNAAPRPFDRRPFERLPRPTEQDPPYRDWWVVEPRRGE